MPPTLILIRHAEALHNSTKDYSIPDPELTEEGHAQLKPLRESLMKHPLAQNAGLIVTSPMVRTLQTAMGSLDWLIDKGVKIEADAGWQENSGKPCDTGHPEAAPRLSRMFPTVDFTTLDPVYPDKLSPAGAHYHPTRAALLERGQAALRRLYDRPEKVIIVVSHSGFLRLCVSGCYYMNADYRIFDFADPAPAGHPDHGLLRLRQHRETEEQGGGLGRSWTDMVVLGSDLPDQLPVKLV